MDISSQSGGFPGGPVVKTPGFPWIPGGGKEDPSCHVAKKRKKRRNCKMSILKNKQPK